ncbi:MAG: hypothetical protein ACXAAO_10185, partial [Candidatus Thorarchaeota archaeon]
MLTSEEHKQRISESIVESIETVNEEPVHLMLAAANSGLSLARVQFQPYLSCDESLISSFVTALRYISNMVFSKPLDKVTIGEYTMIMKVDLPFLFCYVFKGRTRHAIHRLDEFINTILEKTPLLNSLKSTIST